MRPETNLTEEQTSGETPAGDSRPNAPRGGRNAKSMTAKLTSKSLAPWVPWVVAIASIVVAIVLAFVITGGFNIALAALLAGVINGVALFAISFSVEGRRKATDRIATTLVSSTFVLACIPLISLLWLTVSEGLPNLSIDFLSRTLQGMKGSFDQAWVDGDGPLLGGALHAIVGTLLITLAATAMSVPIGVLTAIYLVEYGRKNALAKGITFFVDVMTGIPSIVAGLFAFALFLSVLDFLNLPLTEAKTGFTAAVALSVLMIPIVVRNTEEMLRLVPMDLREATYALGVPKWKTIVRIVLPTAISGILSGVTLSIARVIGETAPIMVTAGIAKNLNWNLFSGWMTTLPTFIYDQVARPIAPGAASASTARAWTAALVLILIVMLLNLAARLIARALAPKAGR